MPKLEVRIVKLMPIIAETGPIGVGTPYIAPAIPQPSMSLFVLKHNNFIDQVETLDRGFMRHDIVGFTPDELEEHIAIALRDNYIVEDGSNTGRFVNGQVAWRLRARTQGYVYERI